MQMIRKALVAIEPWYDWGVIHVERMQELRVENGRLDVGGEGPVRYFALQWLGLHFQVQIGRTPVATRPHS